jgi:hypothetical protein
MTAQTTFSQRSKIRRKTRGFMLPPLALFIMLLLAGGSFIAYVLWPTWPSTPVARDAPALPITVAGTLFEIPPAAIRTAIQRHPGPQERVDLAFLWPSLRPPGPDGAGSSVVSAHGGDSTGTLSGNLAAADASGRLFVTIAPLGSLLPPTERLREIYPHYAETQANVGADGLAILPFRANTPYDGEDLVYRADSPDRFFSLCTRDRGVMPGTCISERILGSTDITLRFPRGWLKDWKSVSDGFHRLLAQLHPQQN